MVRLCSAGRSARDSSAVPTEPTRTQPDRTHIPSPRPRIPSFGIRHPRPDSRKTPSAVSCRAVADTVSKGPLGQRYLSEQPPCEELRRSILLTARSLGIELNGFDVHRAALISSRVHPAKTARRNKGRTMDIKTI